MEFLALLMTGLLTALSPVGMILEQVSGKQISQRLQAAETFEVRVDNLPSHQILSGEIDKVQIASRGVEIIEGLRIETLEIETDPVSFDLKQLRNGKASPAILKKPLQAGVRLVLTEADINNALRSPRVTAMIQPVINRLFTPPNATNPPQLKIRSATFDLLGNNRFKFESKIAQIDPQTGEEEISDLSLAFTLNLRSGSQFQLTEPEGFINGQLLPPQLLNGFAQGFSQGFNLQRFQQRGLTARFLELNMDENQMQAAMFMHFFAQRPQ